MKKSVSGFTIVELLIVVVVIAILATISIVAYAGISDRANNSAVQNDLAAIGKQFEVYKVDKGVYPVGSAQLATLPINVAKGSYGNGFASGGFTYNLLYCRVAADGPDRMALIAASKSGAVFAYRSDTGSVTSLPGWNGGGSQSNCQSVGINQVNVSDRDIFFERDVWNSYVKG